jgi:hypothetical protein
LFGCLKFIVSSFLQTGYGAEEIIAMGIVIPDSALRDRAYGINAGEKYLLNKLKAALPDNCLVWHNIGLPNHYQPDIVAYLPGMG